MLSGIIKLCPYGMPSQATARMRRERDEPSRRWRHTRAMPANNRVSDKVTNFALGRDYFCIKQRITSKSDAWQEWSNLCF
ncbi:hypothetical protein HMPREF1640_02250 [Prevotella sp. S7-1-8]|nr:hypothetical protein HMPREF1640_02250 [Prevotella sp. S7-1-8]